MAEHRSKYEEYFEYVMEETKLDITHEEAEEINKSSNDLICRIWEKALCKTGQFKLSGVIPVGSMADGSRLFSADEFDFMMVLQLKDLPMQKFDLRAGCRPGYVQLYVDDSRIQWQSCFQDKKLHSWEFRKHLISNLQKVGDIADQLGGMKLKKRDFSAVEKHSHTMLRLLGENEIEAWNVLFTCNGKEISVDTMPAIEIGSDQLVSLEKDTEKSLFHNDERRKRAFAGNKTCYLVPKGCQEVDVEEGCGCWLIDFAPTEVALMKSMNQVHKNCQKFLKYIFRNYHFLPSYMIKTAILQHIEECSDAKASKRCCLDMLGYISKCLEDAVMPEHFLKNTNIFGWKVADHLKTASPAVTAILFEHHSRVSRLLLDMHKKLTQVNFQVCNSTDQRSVISGFRSLENVLPHGLHLILAHLFISKIKPGVKSCIQKKGKNSWSNIEELRQLTRPYLETVQWDPIVDFKARQKQTFENLSYMKPLYDLCR